MAEQPRAPLRLHGPGAAEQLEPVPGSLALFLVQFQEQVRGLDIGGVDLEQGAQHGPALQPLARAVQGQDVVQALGLGVERGQEVGAHLQILPVQQASQGPQAGGVEGLLLHALGQGVGQGGPAPGRGRQSRVPAQAAGVAAAHGPIQKEMGQVVVQVVQGLVQREPFQLPGQALVQHVEIVLVHAAPGPRIRGSCNRLPSPGPCTPSAPRPSPASTGPAPPPPPCPAGTRPGSGWTGWAARGSPGPRRGPGRG